MASFVESLYKIVSRRSTIYLPFVFAGAYFFHEGFDYAFEKAWETSNQGKLFKHMTIPVASDDE